MRRSRLYSGIIAGLLLGMPFMAAAGTAPQTERALAPPYREFLALTQYIILPQEKEVFLQLAADRDRDIFMQSFWKQRDPTPGTPQNEFRDEHLKRFQYANKFLGRGTPREGWMTDQGRIHILLGPPVSTDRFEGSSDIYPTQVWYYYGEESKGLPPHFAVVFYKRRGAGEFVLYNPTADGPGSFLIRNEGLDMADYEGLYHRILDIAPTLAPVTLSMIPGEIPFNFQPSLDSNIILSRIMESPAKEVNPAYATHFLEYKGFVSTEYMTNYVGVAVSLAVIPDPVLGSNFVHFSLVPERVSLDYFEEKDQYYCNFKLTVSLRRGEDIIFQYNKDLPVYTSPEDMEKVQAHGFSIEDSFPVIAGKHRVVILLQNSVQKEFSLHEQEITVTDGPTQPVRIIGPFIGPGFQQYPSDLHIPFKVLDKKLLIDPRNTFSLGDDVAIQVVLDNTTRELWEEGLVEVSLQGLGGKDPARKSLSRRLRDIPFQRILGLAFSFPARELPPDYYDVDVILSDSDKDPLDQAKSHLIVSPEAALSHPIANAKAFRLADRYLYLFMLAAQHENSQNDVKAEDLYDRAVRLKPDYAKGVTNYARLLLRRGRFQESLDVIENLKNDQAARFDYYLIKGQALQGMGDYVKAVENLLEANAIYNADTRLLNSLGFCYHRLGRREAALNALKASLRLNPNQESVKSLIAEIEKISRP